MASFQSLVTELGFDVDTEGFEKVRHSIEGINHSVRFLAEVTLIKSLYELAERFAGLGESLESAAITAGLTVEELQRLQFAASQNAVGSGELSGALMRLSRAMTAAQKGSKGASETFQKLGINREQLASFATAEDALYAVQDGIGGLASQQEKLAVVQQLFGRSGGKFLKFLQIGSVATKQLGQAADDMGAVVSEEGVKALAEFEDAASGLGQVIKGFLATIAGTFAPGFIHAIHSIEEAWKKNRQVIAGVLDSLAYKFGYVVGFVGVIIDELSQTIYAALYRKGGLGEWVADIARTTMHWVSVAADFINKLVQSASDDGSLHQLFDDVKGLVQALAGAIVALTSDIAALIKQVAELFGIRTDKLTATTILLRGLLSVLDAMVVTVKTLVEMFNELFSGGLGDATGQGGFGRLYDRAEKGVDAKISSAKRLSTNTASEQFNSGIYGGMSAFEQNASSVSAALGGAVDFLGAHQLARSLSKSSAASKQSADLLQRQSKLSLTSNVTVNVPAYMQPEQLSELVDRTNKKSLLDMINQTDRDHTPAWDY